MSYLKLAILPLGLLVLASCTSSKPSVGEKLKASGAEYSKLAEQWEEGEKNISKGEKLVKQGEKQVREGEKKIKKGQKLIKQGRADMREVEELSPEFAD